MRPVTTAQMPRIRWVPPPGFDVITAHVERRAIIMSVIEHRAEGDVQLFSGRRDECRRFIDIYIEKRNRERFKVWPPTHSRRD